MISGHDIRWTGDLFQMLRNNFGDSKSFDVAYLVGSRWQQGNTSVLEYNKKFNKHHLNIKRAINNNSELDSDVRKFSLTNEDSVYRDIVDSDRALNYLSMPQNPGPSEQRKILR